jgi:hypothetical protein
MPKGAVREPKVFQSNEEATPVAVESKERVYTLSKGPNTWYVVAPTTNTAILDLCRKQGLTVKSATPRHADPAKKADTVFKKLSDEEKDALRKLLAGDPAPVAAAA